MWLTPDGACVSVSSHRGVVGGTSLTSLPVVPVQNAAVGLLHVQSQVENDAIFFL